jgi:hypothetical protein
MANLNTTCPGDAIPDLVNLPIPHDINAVVTIGNDTSYPPMQACCAPNQVQVVKQCWLWCEIPTSYFNGTDRDGAAERMSSCLQLAGWNISDARSRSFQMNTAAGRVGTRSVKWIGIWVLALSGLMYLL